MPRAARKPSQNWWVFHTLSTRGMPTRTALRSLEGGGAERFLANSVRNVGESILGPLHLDFHDLDLVHVLEQALGAGVVDDDALPARGERHLAPGPPGGAGQR